MEDFFLKWQAPEYNHYKRNNDWFWAVGIIVISVATLAFIFDNILFGILIILSAGIMIFYVLRAPKDVEYLINSKGLMMNNELIPYQTIEAFWIENQIHGAKIILKSKKTIMPYIIIPIHEDNVNEINSILSEFIEEKEMYEPTSHKIMEYLGF